MIGSSRDAVSTVCSGLYCVQQGKGRRDKATTRNEEAGQIHEMYKNWLGYLQRNFQASFIFSTDRKT
jgi:hypothetical protein